MKKIFLFVMMFVLMLSFVLAQPPFIPEPQTLDDNLFLETVLIENHPLNTEFYLHTHVYYSDTGLIVDTSDLLCYYHLYDENINWEHKDIGTLTAFGVGMFKRINETNFTQTGLNTILLWCEETVLNIGGFIQFTFNVYDNDEINQKFNLTSNVLYFVLGLALLLIILSFATKEMIFGLLGSFIFLLSGIYLIPILLLFGVIMVIASLMLLFYFAIK